MKRLLLAFATAMVLAGAGVQAQVTITNVYVSASTATTATIVWTTSGPSTSQVLYGLNTGSYFPYSSPLDRTLVTSHSITLNVLNTTTLYNFATVSVDNAGHSTQSATFNFSLCGPPMVPISATANNYYEYGTYSLTWVPPTGSSGTPTVCGGAMQTSITGTLSGGASLSASVADASKVIPGPGQWQLTVTDAGNLSPVTFNSFITFVNQDVSSQLQTAVSTAGLQGVIANINNNTCFPAFVCAGGGGGVSIRTNNTPNTSQALLNFTDANGFHFSNPSGGVLNIAVDGTHFLPINTGSTSLFLTQAGTYAAASGGGSAAGPTGTTQTSNGSGTFTASSNNTLINLLPVQEYLTSVNPPLGTWLAAQPNCAEQVCSYTGVGDSQMIAHQGIASEGPNTYAATYMAQKEALLRQGATSAGTGWKPFLIFLTGGPQYNRDFWAQSGTWVQDATLGPNQGGLGYMVKASTGAVLTFTTTASDPFDTFQFMCVQGPSFGTWNIAIDSVSNGTCGGTAGSPVVQVSTSTAVALGAHTVTVTCPSSFCYGYAGKGRIGTVGVEVNNLAVSGAVAEDYNVTNGYVFLDAMNSTITHIAFGTNEPGLSHTPTTYATAITALAAHQVGNASSILLATPPVNGSGTGSQMVAYATATLGVAQANNYGYLNYQDNPIFGTTFNSTLFDATLVHLNDAGAAAQYSMLNPATTAGQQTLMNLVLVDLKTQTIEATGIIRGLDFSQSSNVNALSGYAGSNLSAGASAQNTYCATSNAGQMCMGATSSAFSVIPGRGYINSGTGILSLLVNSVEKVGITPTLATFNIPVTSSVFNATTGFEIGGAAPSGHCLLGNGTNYVDSATCLTSSPFPIVLGSTSIAANSTTTAVTGLSVNGVTLNAAGSASLFLNQAGGYTTPAGGGNVTTAGFTTGFVPVASSGTALANSLLDYGITTASKFTFGAGVNISDASGLGGGFDNLEGTAHTGASGVDDIWPDSTAHRWKMNNNNAGAFNVVGISTPGTANNCPKLAANGIDLVDSGGTCGGGSPAFSAVTAGTNTAALVMGTGGSLAVSGTGTIAATTTNTIAGNVTFSTGLSVSGAGTIASPYVVTTTGAGATTLASVAAGIAPATSGTYDFNNNAVTFNTLGTATSGAGFNSATTSHCGSYWTGSAGAADCWTEIDTVGAGANPLSVLTFAHTGSSGAATVAFPALSTTLAINSNGGYECSGSFGTTGQVLTSGGANTACTWGSAGGGITFPQTVSGTVPSGGFVYANSTTQISVAPLITAGQAVLSGGAGVAPTGQAIGTSGAVLVKANGANIWSATHQFSQTASGSTVTPFQLINSATTNTSCVEIPIFIEDAVSALTQRSGFKDCQTSNTAGSPSDTVTIEQKNAGTLGNAIVISGPGNVSIQGTITSLIGQGTVSNTPGTGVTSVTCNTATCDVNGGTYTVVGGTFVTGTFVTLTWPTTTTAYRCTVTQNGGTTLLGLGHGVATATGMTVTNAVTVATTTFTFDYSCQP